MKHTWLILMIVLTLTSIACRPADRRLSQTDETQPSTATSVGAALDSGSPEDPDPTEAEAVDDAPAPSTASTTPTTPSAEPAVLIDPDDLGKTLDELDGLLDEINHELAEISAAMNEGE